MPLCRDCLHFSKIEKTVNKGGIDLEKKQNEFYKEDWFVILMLILLFPVGIVLMWHYEKFTKDIRLVITAVLGTFFFIF